MTSLMPTRRYRIGIDARFFLRSNAGLGRYTQELLKHLLPLDPHNEYIVFVTEADLSEWQFNYPNVTPVVVPVVHYTVAEQTKFLKELYAQKLDLVHFLNFNHPVLYRKPFVVTLHDLTLYLFPDQRRKSHLIRKQVFNLVFRRALQAAKKVIAISEFSAFDAERRLHISHAKMEVIYEGGPEPMRFLAGSKEMVHQYLGTRDPYFLFVSQWRPHKGLTTLIEAFTRFKEQTGLPHRLVLVGNPELASEAVKTALVESSAASDIIAPGFAPDDMLPPLFHYATAFVMPSEYEGFGLPVLEAYANGTPVIAADNSSLPEVVGQGGLLFPTKDSAMLAQHMIRIATEPKLADELTKKGAEQLKKFSWAECAQRTLEVYLSILEKGR